MKTKKSCAAAVPIFRFRSMLLGIVILGAAISGPLLLVWKQVYINSVSLKMERKNDTLTVLRREIAGLELQCQQLASNARIEGIARTSLGLEYPTSEQIVILKVSDTRHATVGGWTQNLLAFLKKSIRGDRG